MQPRGSFSYVKGLEAYRATGAEAGRSWFLGLLAEACGNHGQTKEGLAAVTEALIMVADTDERFYEAELYRLKGELTAGSQDVQSQRV